MSGNFKIRFYNKEALKEYRKLDGSERKLVDIALRKLQVRADEIGVPLHGDLSGCKKVKWRKLGLRMVFRVLEDGTIEIVEIIAIGRRDRLEVYKTAELRLSDQSVVIDYDGRKR